MRTGSRDPKTSDLVSLGRGAQSSPPLFSCPTHLLGERKSMMERGIFDGQFSEASGSPARLRQKSSVWFARGPARYASLALAVFSCIFIQAAGAVHAASCPTNAAEIGAPQQYIFPTSQQSNIVFITYMTMARRAPALYTATKYGVVGAYLGSNPADPTPTVDNISFRTNPKGPVGGGTGKDCWPGPSSIAVADQASGAGRVAMGWSGGCGSPAQVAIANVPGGQSTFGQQIDAAGGGGAVFGGTVATALTSSGNYAAYFAD